MSLKAWTGYLIPLLLITAACTSAPDTPDVATVDGTATPRATTTASRLEQLIRYSQCMREHGVPMTDPQADGGGVREGRVEPGFDKSKTDAAIASCQQFRPPRETGPQADLKTELSRLMARCMRENGVENFPDPNPDGATRIPDEVGADPQYPDAKRLCDARVDAAFASANAQPSR
jgi:hypothetical protein